MLGSCRRAAFAANLLMTWGTILAFETAPAFLPPAPCGGGRAARPAARAPPGCCAAGLHMGLRDSGGPEAGPEGSCADGVGAPKHGRRVPMMDFLRAPKGTYRYVRLDAKEVSGGLAGGLPGPEGVSGVVEQAPPRQLLSFLNLPSGTYRTYANRDPSQGLPGTSDGDLFEGGKDLSVMSADEIARSLSRELTEDTEMGFEDEAPPQAPAGQGRRRGALLGAIRGMIPFKAFKREPAVDEAAQAVSDVLAEPGEDALAHPAEALAVEGCGDELATEDVAGQEQELLSSGTQKFDPAPMRRRRGLLMTLRMAEMVLAVGIRDLTTAAASAVGIKVLEAAVLGQDFSQAGVSLEAVAICVIAFRGISDGLSLPVFTLDHLEPQIRQMLGKPARVWEYARLQGVRSMSKMTPSGECAGQEAEDGGSQPQRRPQQYSYYEKAFATLALLLTSAQASAEQMSDLFFKE